MQSKKISELSVKEWLQELQGGYGCDVEIVLRADGSGTIRRSGANEAYFHTPPDALPWLSQPDRELADVEVPV